MNSTLEQIRVFCCFLVIPALVSVLSVNAGVTLLIRHQVSESHEMGNGNRLFCFVFLFSNCLVSL